VNYPLFQESFFYYLFGVKEPYFYGVIEVDSEKAHLFVTKMDELYKIWMTVMSLEDLSAKYKVEVHYIDEMEQFISDLKPEMIYLNAGTNSDSELQTLIPEEKYWSRYPADKETLWHHLSDARAVKSEAEIEAMKWASKIACEAHCEVMRRAKAGMRECELESIFKAYCEQKYHCGRV